MTRPRSTFALQLLIAFGIALACAGIVLHLALPARYERAEILPVVVGFGLALYGATWLDPNRSRDAAAVVTETGGRIVHSVVELRTGDRASDPVVKIEKTGDSATPEQPDAVTVSVTSQGGAPRGATVEPTTAPQNPVAWVDPRHDADGVI